MEKKIICKNHKQAAAEAAATAATAAEKRVKHTLMDMDRPELRYLMGSLSYSILLLFIICIYIIRATAIVCVHRFLLFVHVLIIERM